MQAHARLFLYVTDLLRLMKAELRMHVLPLLGLLLLSLYMIAAILAMPSWFYSFDGMQYPLFQRQFNEAWDSGVGYPRWLPDMIGGYGYPTFTLYQPGFFYLGLLVSHFTSDVLLVVKLTAGVAFFIGGVGAYMLAGVFIQSRSIRFLLSVLFLFTPYLQFNFLPRADYTEFLSMMFCPWLFWAWLRLKENLLAGKPYGGYALGFILSSVFMVYTHPFVPFYFMPLMAILIVLESRRERSWELFFVPFGLFAVGMVLTAPYWVHIPQLIQHVNYDFSVDGHFDTRKWLFDFQQRLYAISPEVLFTLNPKATQCWLFFGTVIGLLLAIPQTFARVLLVFYLLMLVLLYDFADKFWEIGDPVLGLLQFPFRVDAVLVTVQLVGIAYLISFTRTYLRERYYLALWCLVLPGVVLFSSFQRAIDIFYPAKVTLEGMGATSQHLTMLQGQQIHLKGFDFYEILDSLLLADGPVYYHFNSGFMPKLNDVKGLRNRLVHPIPVVDKIAPEDDVTLQQLEEHSKFYINYNVTSAKDNFSVVINQFYFPGWRLEVNQQPVEIMPEKIDRSQAEYQWTLPVWSTLDAHGRIVVHFEKAGLYRIDAWYDGPPGSRIRNAAMIVIMIGLVLILHRRYKVFRFSNKGPSHG